MCIRDRYIYSFGFQINISISPYYMIYSLGGYISSCFFFYKFSISFYLGASLHLLSITQSISSLIIISQYFISQISQYKEPLQLALFYFFQSSEDSFTSRQIVKSSGTL
eukprot:TRINITY_DN29455_c0_g1_i1.p2 TRINITY_DN29455_c0_g1~~TRINITY_DN29455_c0_g1_i1.p2  ORF type:complete len:109 (+),score=1.03 TRINITY_DN29455_c0_g1_i1:143-469(+)